jgi:PAS domain S-box-containing protein
VEHGIADDGGSAPGVRRDRTDDVKTALAAALADAIGERALTQTEAARRCRTDQPTLSKVLHGRLELVSVDKLLAWLAALGAGVEIRVGPGNPGPGVGVSRVAETEVPQEPDGARLDLAVRAAGIGVFDWHVPSGRVVWSEEEERIFGLEPGTFEGDIEGWAAHVLPEDLARMQAAIEESMARREPGLEFHFRIRRPDGEIRHLEGGARFLYARDGTPLRMVGVNIDATARRRAEEALRESEQRYRALIETSPDAIYVHRDGVIILANPRAADLLGAASAEELIGCPVFQLVDPASLATARARTARLRVPGDCNEPVPLTMRRFDGSTVPVEAASAAVLFDGRVAIQAVLRDVTAREGAAAALRQSEERYRATQEHAGVGIAEIDGEGRFLRVNAALCAITGYGREELLERTVFAISHPEDAAAERDACARLVAGKADTYTREKRYLRKDGGERWVQVAATAVRDARGTFLYAVRVVMDVHDRKRAELQQRLLLNELNHRVKNTLAVVQGIARHSLAQGRTVEEGGFVLERRLGALAAAHGLLSAGHWQGADLRELVAAELAPYGESRVVAEGPPIVLPPDAALTLGLVLHELATNAMKHGALSVPGGRIDVRWDVGCGQALRLSWRESGGPEVVPPGRRGFGSLLVESSVAYNLKGASRLEFRPEGLLYEAEIPLGRGDA